MATRTHTQKPSSSWTPAATKIKGFTGPHPFPDLAKPNSQSVSSKEIPAYSSKAADRLHANVMRTFQAKVQEEANLRPIPEKGQEELDSSHATELEQADFETRLNRAKGGGSPLDNAFRAKVELARGADFSGVKVHTDAEADRLSPSIQAKAFTIGQDIFFSQGAYSPSSSGGQKLLVYELTHASRSGHQSVAALQRKARNRAVGGILQHSTTRPEALDLVPSVQRDAREVRIRAASRAYTIPPGTSGCYLHLLLLIDAGRNVRPLTTAGEVHRYRKLKRIARGATVSDLVALLRKKGIARRSRWFHYPKAGRSYRTLKKLSLRGNPEGFVMSRVRTGQPAYFAVDFRNIHSGFILVTSAGKVLWLDQIHRGGTEVTGSLNGFLSRYLDGYVENNRKKHAWYGSTKITELRF